MTTLKVVGVGFDHMHIGDQLALVHASSDAEVVGAFDATPRRSREVLDDLGLDVPVFTSLAKLIDAARPDVALVCTTTAEHLPAVRALATAGVHMILEKPFGDSLAAVDEMIASARAGDVALAVNWPLAWYPSHRTTQRLISDDAIGRVQSIHFYDGNRGPLFHSHGKAVVDPGIDQKATSWWYSPENGGGSLRDYLGYGVTLGTWFLAGELPRAVTAATHVPEGLRVDEQAVVIAHYERGLSVFETRWGTFTDPWDVQPEPRCGFIISGERGSITSWDYDDHVTVHDASGKSSIPVDTQDPRDENSVANLLAHLLEGRALDGPMTPELSRSGQVLVEAAVASAMSQRTVELRPGNPS